MRLFIYLLLPVLLGCGQTVNPNTVPHDSISVKDSAIPAFIDSLNPLISNLSDTIKISKQKPIEQVKPKELLEYAKSLIGVKYKYASASPQNGFDCAGFVYYVFKHFNINVPRSSAEYMDFGKEVALLKAKPGDILLFTGTDSAASNHVGHVGIVYQTGDTLKFIQSTSGKAFSVTISSFTEGYKHRFIKVVRVLPQNE